MELDDGNFSLGYTKTLTNALQEKVEIPVFLSKIEMQPDELDLDYIFRMLQKPEIFSEEKNVETIWSHFLNGDQRIVTELVFSDKYEQQSIFLKTGEDLPTAWFMHLVDTKNFEMIGKLLEKPRFVLEYKNLVPKAISAFLQVDENPNDTIITYLLETAD